MTETAKFANVVLPGLLVPGKERHLHQCRAPRAARERGRSSRCAGTKPDGQIVVRDHAAHGLSAGRTTPRTACSRKSPASCRSSKARPGRVWATTASSGPSARTAAAPQILHTGILQARPRQVPLLPTGRSPTSSWRTRGEFPFILTTGRLLEHYNCGTMTRRTGNSADRDRGRPGHQSRTMPRARASPTATWCACSPPAARWTWRHASRRSEARHPLHHLPLPRAMVNNVTSGEH